MKARRLCKGLGWKPTKSLMIATLALAGVCLGAFLASAYYLPVTVGGFTGTGICVANGTYNYEQKLNGKCVFRKGEHVIIWRGSYWEIFWDGPGVDIQIARTSQSCGMLPPPTGWTLTNGCGGSLVLSGGVCESVPPSITSIVRQSPTEEDTTADTVTFRVTFDEQVLNTSPDGSDFVVSGTATGTVSSLTNVVNHTVFDVTVTGISGSGELDLDIAPGNDITDNNPIVLGANPTIGYEETYNILPSNPDVAGVSPSDTLLSDADAGSAFTVTIDFSMDMTTDGSADPTLMFTPNVDTTLSFESGLWTDNDTYVATYSITDAGVDEDSVSIDVTGARSASGADQSDYAPQHEFAIDTENPTLLSTTLSHTVITRANIGETFEMVNVLSERSSTYSQQYFSPNVSNSGSGTLVYIGGDWDQTTYPNDTAKMRYQIIDTGETVYDVDVGMNIFRDLAGNEMEPSPSFLADALDIILGGPEVVSVSVSDTLLSDADAGGTFTVAVDFSEDMTTDGSADPTITFSPNVDSTLTFSSGTWNDGDTYLATYSIADAGVDEDSVTIDVTGAKGANDYEQEDYTPEHEFEIDTLNPTVLSIAPSSLLINDALVGSDTFQYEIVFSESVTGIPAANGKSGGVNVSHTIVRKNDVWSATAMANDTLTRTFDVVDANRTAPDVSVEVKHEPSQGYPATDLAGNPLVTRTFTNVYDIDTENPEVFSVDIDDPLQTDADAGQLMTFTVRFSESMKTNIGCLWENWPDTHLDDISYYPTTSFYQTVYPNDTARMRYRLSDLGTQLADIDVAMGCAQDSAGNTVSPDPTPFPDVYSIDTLNPSVVSVTVSDTLISDADAGNTFTVTVDFSEDMTTDGSADPTIVFSPNVDTTLSFDSGSWTDGNTFAATYTIADAGVDEDSVSIDISGAKDANGNSQQDYTPVHEFEIDTQSITVTVENVDLSGNPLGGDVTVGVNSIGLLHEWVSSPDSYTQPEGDSAWVAAVWGGLKLNSVTVGEIYSDTTYSVDAITRTVSSTITPGTTKIQVVYEPVDVILIMQSGTGSPLSGRASVNGHGGTGFGLGWVYPTVTYKQARTAEIQFSAIWGGLNTGAFDWISINEDTSYILDSVTKAIASFATPGLCVVSLVFEPMEVEVRLVSDLGVSMNGMIYGQAPSDYLHFGWSASPVTYTQARTAQMHYTSDVGSGSTGYCDWTVINSDTTYTVNPDTGSVTSSPSPGLSLVLIEFDLHPAVLSVTADDTTISGSDAGASVSITVEFDRAMTTDGSADPTITFSPDVASTLTFSSGLWTGSTTYAASYDISDNDVEMTSVSVDIEDAKDAEGDVQEDYLPSHELSIDTRGPDIIGLPADVLVEIRQGRDCAQVTWAEPSAADGMSGVMSLTSTHSPGDSFPVGSTTVTYTALDGVGNMSWASFDVTVVQIQDALTLDPAKGPTSEFYLAGQHDPIYDFDVYGQLPCCGTFTIDEQASISGGCIVRDCQGNVQRNRWVIVELYKLTRHGNEEALKKVWRGELARFDPELGYYPFEIPLDLEEIEKHGAGTYDVYLAIGYEVYQQIRIELR